MPERTVQIVNRNGLHARPAAEIVKLASKFQCEITIVKDDLDVNGKSIMGVMMLQDLLPLKNTKSVESLK